MNLGAFAIVAFLRNAMRSEEIADYAGLIRRSPVVVVCFSMILFSLIGLPPLAGFIGKLLIFYSLVRGQAVDRAGHRRLEHRDQPVLLFAGREDDDDRSRAREPSAGRRMSFIPGTFVVAIDAAARSSCSSGGTSLNDLALAAARHLF